MQLKSNHLTLLSRATPHYINFTLRSFQNIIYEKPRKVPNICRPRGLFSPTSPRQIGKAVISPHFNKASILAANTLFGGCTYVFVQQFTPCGGITP